jgi:hypothetical protein
VRVGGEIGGTLTLDWSDPLWEDVGGTAGYVQRMAVRRRAAGLGAVMLRWAADAVRDQARTRCAWTASRPTTGCAPTTRQPASGTAATCRSAARPASGWTSPRSSW